jgi:hypothetical protein
MRRLPTIRFWNLEALPPPSLTQHGVFGQQGVDLAKVAALRRTRLFPKRAPSHTEPWRRRARCHCNGTKIHCAGMNIDALAFENVIRSMVRHKQVLMLDGEVAVTARKKMAPPNA